MKFALICHSVFDARIGYGLSNALRDLGHSCTMFDRSSKTKQALANFDIVIEPQHGRSEAIPAEAVYIAWCFEYYGAGDPDYSTLTERDLLYTFGDPDVLGCPPFPQRAGSLTLAVEPELLNKPLIEPTLDLSIAGFIAPLNWFFFPTLMPVGNHFDIIAEITQLVTRTTQIAVFSGAFDQPAEVAKFKKNVAELIAERGWKFDQRWMDDIHAFGAKLLHNCARLANRGMLAKQALKVSKDIEFWGLNWDAWDVTARYAHPFVVEQEPLHDLYQRSRINLHDNIFGFSIHFRVLDAMAVGGFVMAHESPHVGKAGQMTETFEPDVHFGEYGPANFIERAQYWLKSPELRQKAAIEARKVIRDKHLWKNRAQQILKDLGLCVSPSFPSIDTTPRPAAACAMP